MAANGILYFLNSLYSHSHYNIIHTQMFIYCTYTHAHTIKEYINKGVTIMEGMNLLFSNSLASGYT